MSTKFLFLLTFSLFLVVSLATSQPQTVAGNWQGALSVQGTNLRIIFKITDAAGLHAVMDSPDQGAQNIPCDTVIVSGTKITIGMKSIGGEYAGTFSGDTSIEGDWSQGGASLPLALHRTDKPVEVLRPQEPKPPYPYNEEEVSYVNPSAGDTLAGTLTTPKTGGPFAVVLLITGSGPQNRNEALLGHKPFLVIADYLTRQGIAVLRVDDRGVGKSTGDFSKATTKDFATDVTAGIAYLKTRKEINPKKIGLLGHSEGGLIAPMVASKSKDVAFIVMLAGPGVPGEEILIAQSELIDKANGIPDEAIKKESAMSRKLFALLKAEPDTAAAAKKMLEIIADARKNFSAKDLQDLGLTEETAPMLVKQFNSPWFRFFLSYDPRPALEHVKCPVLALNGEKDMQVPPDQNLPAIEKALKKGGNKHFTFEKLPGLNHLFQTCTTGSPMEYAKIEETMSPLALKKIGDWIVKRMK